MLAGYLFTLHPNAAHVTKLDAPVVEVQTCEQGLGLGIKAATSGVVSLHTQYGWTKDLTPFSLTLTPKLGVGFLDNPVPELSSTTNVSLGFQVLAGYRAARVGVEYLHQSNAGLGTVNTGLDMLLVMAGWGF